MSTIENLLYFYNENKDKIFIPAKDIGKHKINYDKIEEWIEAIKNAKVSRICGRQDRKKGYKIVGNCDQENATRVYLLFAYFFKKYFRYIPFDEMIGRMTLISQEIKDLVNNVRYDNIIFYITGSLYKSNIWITLLFINKLLEIGFFTNEIKLKIKIILHERNEPVGLNSNIKNFITENEDKKCLVLHFDDMSYSGWQISADTAKNVDFNKTDWYLCVAYVSTSAKKYFEEEKNFFKYFENTEVINSFKDSIINYKEKTQNNPKNSDQEIENHITNNFSYKEEAYSKLFDLLNNKEGYYYGEKAFAIKRECKTADEDHDLQRIPVYFDHKLADNKSTFQKLMRSGSFPSDLEGCKYIPLIEGCGPDPFNGEGCGDNGRKENQLLEEDACPKTFYKTISYSCNDETYKDDQYKIGGAIKLSAIFEKIEREKPHLVPETQEMENKKKVFFFSRELFEKTYSKACGKLVMNILKTLCFNIIDGVKYGSNQHIDLEFKNTYAIGLLTSENNSELVIEGMTFLKKKGDGVQVTTDKKIEVSGNGTDEFLYIDLMCTKKGQGNGKMLFNAVESLASVEGMEKIVLYWAGNADSFWRHMGFVEESDDAKKYYSDGTTIYKDSGTRMEKPVPRESRQPYNIISNAGDLKELFVRIKNIFGNDLKCKDGKRGQIPENNEIGLDFKKVEGVMPVVLAVKKNKIQVALSVRKEPTNKKKFTFFPGNCLHKPSSKNVLKHLNKSFKKYVQERRLNTQMTQISIYLIILILLQ